MLKRVMLSALMMAGCSESPMAGVVQSGRTVDDLVPSFGDLTSNIGTTALAVTIRGRGNDDLANAALANALVLRTYPEGDAVPGAVTATTTGDVGAPATVLTFTPTAALTDRWYAFGLSTFDATQFDPPAIWVGGSDAGTYARFRTGSAPVVAHFQVCPKDTTTDAIIDVSESIDVAVGTLTVTMPGADCALTQSSGNQILVSCDQSPEDAKVSVTFNAGIAAPSGVTLDVLDRMTTPESFVDATGASYVLEGGPLVSGCQDYPVAF